MVSQLYRWAGRIFLACPSTLNHTHLGLVEISTVPGLVVSLITYCPSWESLTISNIGLWVPSVVGDPEDLVFSIIFHKHNITITMLSVCSLSLCKTQGQIPHVWRSSTTLILSWTLISLKLSLDYAIHVKSYICIFTLWDRPVNISMGPDHKLPQTHLKKIKLILSHTDILLVWYFSL